MKNLGTFAVCIVFAYFGNLAVQAKNIEIDANSNTDLSRNKRSDLNRDKMLLVEQFRNQNRQFLTDDLMRSENHIVGLLRASQWKVPIASKLLKKVLRWRNVNKIDALGHAEINRRTMSSFPYRIDALTKDGCPVLEIDASDWQFADYMGSTEFVRDAIKMFVRHVGQMVEKSFLATKNLSPKCDQVVVLVDLKGFDSRNIADPNAITSIIKVSTDAEAYYGNLFKSLMFINTPPDFLSIITLLKTYMGHTGEVLTVFSSDETEKAREAIHYYVHPQQLGTKFLGTKQI